MAADMPKEQQQLTLKVMRLTHASFSTPGENKFSVGCLDPNSLDSEAMASDPNFLVSNSLLLPQSIENIYLGETFSCYICLHNDSNTSVKDVCLKIDLQTSTQRISLPTKNQNFSTELKPEECLGEVVSHEVKEMGQHILVCAVTYLLPSGEKPYFRKFFKFPVAKPLDVRTKFYNAEVFINKRYEEMSDEVFLEAQIQNMAHLPMVLDRVVLEPSPLYSVEELTVASLGNQKHLVDNHCESAYLNPSDTRQFLYCLKPDKKQPLKIYKGITNVGKIDMIWYTTNGERGRLQTSQLQRVVPGSGDLRLMVEYAPSTVKMGADFSIRLRLYNCVERSLDLTLALDNSLNRGLSWSTPMEQQSCGQISVGCHLDVTLDLKAEEVGLHAISGIRIRDTLLDRLYEYDEVAQIFVFS